MRLRNVDGYVQFSVTVAIHSRAIDHSISHPGDDRDASAHELDVARRDQMKRGERAVQADAARILLRAQKKPRQGNAGA